MTLEIEKLLKGIDSMAQATAQRLQDRKSTADDLLQILDQYASDWVAIEAALDHAQQLADPKLYRSARPFDHIQPLNAQINPAAPPAQAIIVATDGSQIMPDRHAAHLYYLINIGGIIYFYGGSRAPQPFTIPELHYPANDQEAAQFVMGSGEVSIARDLREIGTLADTAWNLRGGDQPVLAVLDQRLLYWPIGDIEAPLNDKVLAWLKGMTKVRDAGALLAGFIDRPMTTAVVTLLRSLTGLGDPKFDWKSLGKSGAGGGLNDVALFRRLLEPGQRSKVFVNVSPPNARFAEHDRANEVCFFYFHSGRGIARVDIPRWVAEDEGGVTAVHALLHDQCQILGDYPYVIARADEMAVVGHQDHEELNFMIDLTMQKYGISSSLTAKQGSKGLARGGKTRFMGP
ncbi:MAG: DNA double-strand break repair nuclease NurA [Ardenticatenaceae bacterium]|nr:DNA double-strand break repair nuclease NurA [Ardenticatenaceae bacterium]MCB8989945.1 DNA double-strand break repair nuclease NurA [Ardenticatenaceae bacterium]MCB9005388.1 DNA double-strand break repair nuclease NurA [Ardenticatenaceae bacterium]